MISYLPTLDAIPAPVANVSLNTNRITNLVDPSAAQDAATQNFVSNAIAAISQTNNSQVISGCGVVWTGNLNFTVAAGSYSINNVTYSISQTNLTLNTADPTNPRFDVIAVNTSNAAVVITGTPAANPLIPTVDPSTQLLLTSVYVPAGASQPGNITNLVQYAEDAGAPTEWNATTNSAGTINLASTNNPHSGTKCIEVTATGSGNYIQLAQGTGTVNLSNYNSLVFYIAPKAGWPSQKSLTISFLNAGTQQGNALTFQNGSFGFVSSNTAYQQIVIPLSNFNIGNTAVNQLKFLTAGGGSTFGFYMDDVSLQAGVMVGSQAFMIWRNAWSSQTAYTANNVVVDGRGLWLCLLPNTNSEPNEGNTNWQWLSSQVNVTRNDYGSFTIPDGGALSQPSQLTLTGSEQLTVTGSGQLSVFDPANVFSGKLTNNPSSIIMRQGEYTRFRSQFTLAGNEQLQLTEDAQVFVQDDPPLFVDPIVAAYRAMGSQIIAQPIGQNAFTCGALGTFTNQQLVMTAIYLPSPTTLTGLKFYQHTTGNYTANNNNKMGLYACLNGASFVLVASSSNNGNLWKGTADTVQSVPFTSQYQASPGIYYAAFLWNNSANTTTPQVSATSTVNAANFILLDFSSALVYALATQTDLPATLQTSQLTIATLTYWAALY